LDNTVDWLTPNQLLEHIIFKSAEPKDMKMHKISGILAIRNSMFKLDGVTKMGNSLKASFRKENL